MCGGSCVPEEPDYELVKVPVRRVVVREEVVKETNLIVKDGMVVVDEPGYPPVRISRGLIDKHVRVGCHKVSREAWELIKAKIDKTEKFIES
jgi:hypothetical protein